VFLALENHGGGTTASGKQMVGILEAIAPCPWFGFNLDTGNFGTPDPYADMRIVAPHAVNVQIKVSLSVDGTKQAADWPRIVGILRDSGYKGYVVLEYEEKEEPREAIPPLVETLQKLLDA
jgi:sugar phosphate isomerase/epimerase